MATSIGPRQLALDYGQAKKRKNAVAAILSGALPGAILAFYFPCGWRRWLLGLAIGLVWGNAFEYSYHRWLLHRPRGGLAKGHLQHHANVGTPAEAEHVALGKSPWYIAILFAVNGILVIAADLLWSLRISPGIFAGWTVYLISAEEIHWRIHLKGWLPPGLGPARAYHIAHHDTPNTRYNVFLPLFDLLLGTSQGYQNQVTHRRPTLPLQNK
ncbi:MAG: sterol desaturase family protein [Acidobacteria bacterium]|nr:sterol desaturase family protein [Acidobacteriota bacterium]